MIGRASLNAGTQHTAAPGRRKVALALQGGGSHGAFTWGVLDRLLDDETIEIIGVTGTSAGAMNGAVLVDGLVRGERLCQFVFFEHVIEFGNCSERFVRALGACQVDQQLGQLRKIPAIRLSWLDTSLRCQLATFAITK